MQIKQHAQNLIREADAKRAKELSESANGAKRGQKMTAEELRFNKQLLKEVSKIKKEGNFAALLEQCNNSNTKVTKMDG